MVVTRAMALLAGAVWEGKRLCPGPRCLAEIPANRALCHFCSRTAGVAAIPMPRRVGSYVAGSHYPRPYLAGDTWRCFDCLNRVRLYRDEMGVRRFRHYRASVA